MKKKLIIKQRAALLKQLNDAIDKKDSGSVQLLIGKISELDQQIRHSNLQPTEKAAWEKDAALKEINDKLFMGKQVFSTIKCPKCGDPNHGNTINGKPFCMKCNQYLKII